MYEYKFNLIIFFMLLIVTACSSNGSGLSRQEKELMLHGDEYNNYDRIVAAKHYQRNGEYERGLQILQHGIKQSHVESFIAAGEIHLDRGTPLEGYRLIDEVYPYNANNERIKYLRDRLIVAGKADQLQWLFKEDKRIKRENSDLLEDLSVVCKNVQSISSLKMDECDEELRQQQE